MVRVNADQTYASTLKGVRHGLVNAGLSDGITGARKTNNGDLLLKLKRNTDTEKIKTIATVATGSEVSAPTSKVAIEIRGLDGDVTKEDLIVYFKTNSYMNLCAEDVKSLKPGRLGKITAVVVLPVNIVNKLSTGPRIKIGWSYCRIYIRKPIIRCLRCLEFGHRKFKCDGPDRTNTCLNCWKTGHVRKDCETEAHCGLCDEDGDDKSGNHFSGGGKCAAFRRFLQKSKTK